MSRSSFNDLIEAGDDAFVSDIIEDWEGIKDEDGDDVPFNESNKAVLLMIPTFCVV